MANLLQSSATKATTVPQFYTCYLQNLATKGQQAQACAQYVGAQPLQQEAFCKVSSNFGASQPTFQQGISTVGCAANKNVLGAAQPFLSAGTSASPLCAAKPLICQSANLNLGSVAQCYMSPYISSAVNQMSDIAQRNIQQNLAPQATAAAVGSGQFGSQRGAQVLGQVEANAEQCLNNTIANMENTGYGQALQGAGAKQGALSTLAGTTAQAQQAQNQANLTAGQTAGTLAGQCAQIKTQAGLGLGTLGSEAAAQNLSCINALSALGTQCQTIKQNAQCYPLSTLTKLSGLMQGQQIPTTVTSTMCMSPLSAAGAIGSGVLGLFCTPQGGTSLFCNVKNSLSNLTNSANGGLIQAKAHGGRVGCASLKHRGGLPSGSK